MTGPETNVQQGLVDQSFNTLQSFCDKLGSELGVQASCGKHDPAETTLGQALAGQDGFADPIGIIFISRQQSNDPAGCLLLGRAGLFTLAGVVGMQPKEVVEQNREAGAAEQAETLQAALHEAAELLAAAWTNSSGPAGDEQDSFAPGQVLTGDCRKQFEQIWPGDASAASCAMLQVTLEPFPQFECALAMADLAGGAASPSRPEPEQQQGQPQHKTEQDAQEQTPGGEKDSAGPAEGDEQAQQDQPAQESEAPGSQESDLPPAEERQSQKQPAESESLEQQVEAADGREEEQQGGEQQPVSAAIRKLLGQSGLQGRVRAGGRSPLTTPAAAVMTSDVLWVAPEETVGQTLARMQRDNVRYALVGTDGLPEGIVSASDVRAALSPYLQHKFSKWRRQSDVATQQIKLRWIMSRPVHTIRSETPLQIVMEIMQRYHRQCLPVTDDDDNIIGLVTVFDVLRALVGPA